MTPLLNLTEMTGGRLLVTGALLLLTAQIFIALQAQRQRRSALLICLHVLHAAIGFCLTVCLMDGIYRLPDSETHYTSIVPVVRLLFSLPWVAVAATELISAMLLVIAYHDNRRYAKTHLLPSSIKEAVDLLPDGICFAREDGAVSLHNLKMDTLCRSVTGKPLTDFDRLWDAVCARGEDRNGQVFVQIDSVSTFLFARDVITVGSETYIQLIASDVTEQYRITAELAANNARLKDIQLRMRKLQVKASQMFMSREIMNARSVVHDEVGHALLAARYYLEHPENTDEEVLLTLMRQTNNVLLREKEEADTELTDRLGEALKMAKGIGVNVHIDGVIPSGDKIRELL